MFRFRVTPDNQEPFEATAVSRDVVRWEAIPGRPRYVGSLEKTPRMTDLSELAWCAATRQGLWDGPLKEFLATVDVLPLVAEEDPETQEPRQLDPTHWGA